MYDDSICILCFTVLLRLSLATRLWPPAFPPNQPSPQPLPGSSRSLILPSNLRSRISQTCEIPANGSNPRRWGDTTFGTWRLYRGMSAWRRVPARRCPQPTDTITNSINSLICFCIKKSGLSAECLQGTRRWTDKSSQGSQRIHGENE